MQNDNFLFTGLLLSLCLVGVSVCGLLVYTEYEDTKIISSQMGSELLLQHRKSEADYIKFSKSGFATVSGRVFDVHPNGSGIYSGGIENTLFFLSEADYETLQRDYYRHRKCAARFLRSSVKVLGLVNGQTPHAKTTPSVLRKGMKFTLSGKNLVYQGGSVNGSRVILPGNVNYFLVERVILSQVKI